MCLESTSYVNDNCVSRTSKFEKPRTMGYKIVIPEFMKSRLFKFGVPFFLFVVGGSFGLREFTDLRYRYSKVKTVKREDLAALGLEMKKPEETTIEAEYQKTLELDIEHWENKRIPRPWEKDGKLI